MTPSTVEMFFSHWYAFLLLSNSLCLASVRQLLNLSDMLACCYFPVITFIPSSFDFGQPVDLRYLKKF